MCKNENLFNFKNIFNNNGFQNDHEDELDIYSHTGHSCKYFNIDEFSNKYSNVNQQVSFFALNIHSLQNKFSGLLDIIETIQKDKFKFSVISLTEVWNVPNLKLLTYLVIILFTLQHEINII